MSVRLVRWNLVDEDGTVTGVLRLLRHDQPLTDPEHADCFPEAAAAADAAWLLSGGASPEGGSWLEEADRVLAGPPEDAIGPRDKPRPRLVDSDRIARGEIGWLFGAAGQSLAEGSTTGVAALPQLSALDAFFEAEPLSGTKTNDWALVEQAGAPSRAAPKPDPDALDAQTDLPLSGQFTREWALADFAGVVAGSGEKPKDD